MVHEFWTGRNGAPQGITALAQTPDHRLWIGTVAGLYSFNGFTFQAVPLPSSAGASVISRRLGSLFVDRSGGLWVGGREKGLVYFHGGLGTEVGLLHGQHARFDSLQQDPQGRVWAVLNDNLLAVCNGDHIWHVVPGPVSKPTLISGIFFDSSGTLWAVVDDHLYRKAPGESAFLRTGIVAEGDVHFAEAADQTLWLVGHTPTQHGRAVRDTDLRHLDAAGHPLDLPFLHQDVSAVLVSHNATLWVLESELGKRGERTSVLTRHEGSGHAWQTDSVKSGAGMGASEAHTMLEDVDGNLWVGGERQLERLRPAALRPLAPDLRGDAWIFCTPPNGSLWVASGSGLLMHVVQGKRVMLHGQDRPYKLVCRRDGSAWMLDGKGLSLVSGKGIQRFPLLANHSRYLDNWGFSDVLETRDGRVLVAEHGAGESRLWQLAQGRWRPFSPSLQGHPVHASLEDDTGTLFFGGLDNFVATAHGQAVKRIPVTGGVLGDICTFARIGSEIFALGSEGIAVYKAGRFQRLLFHDPAAAQLTSGMVLAGQQGTFWINGRKGTVFFPASELSAAIDDPHHEIQSTTLHEGDFVGPALSGITSASAALDNKGTVWFSTLNGVVSLNAAAGQLPVRPPALSIEAEDADGKPFTDHASLPPHLATLRIRYLGLSLTRTQDVRYSYRMEGVDRDWQSVGARTEAVYTSLKPAHYRFLVRSAFDNERWSQPVELTFQIRPAFYQTWWFLAVCSFLLLLLVAGALQLRLRFVAGLLRERAEQRADERVRIARDLHDTLLQGMQGLLMSFHVAAQSTPENTRTRELLERALRSADRLLVEGRNSVSALRGEHPNDGSDLLTSLRRAGQELNTAEQKVLHIAAQGRQRPLQSSAQAELYFIGREALTNAFRHSEATQIDLVLEYGARVFTLTCADNGRGIPQEVPGTSKQRWGIQGMKERVAGLGGQLHLTSSPESGTRVTVTLASSSTYL